MAFPAGFAAHTETVRPEWIDYNGHMNVAYYVLVFDHATDTLFDALGLDAAYRARSGCSLFAVESHILYQREVGLGTPLRVESRVLGVDAKRLHFAHEMFHGLEGWRAATIELMAVHIDLAARRSCPFPPDRRQMIEAAAEAQGHLPVPDWVGRSLSLSQRRV